MRLCVGWRVCALVGALNLSALIYRNIINSTPVMRLSSCNNVDGMGVSGIAAMPNVLPACASATLAAPRQGRILSGVCLPLRLRTIRMYPQIIKCESALDRAARDSPTLSPGGRKKRGIRRRGPGPLAAIARNPPKT